MALGIIIINGSLPAANPPNNLTPSSAENPMAPRVIVVLSADQAGVLSATVNRRTRVPLQNLRDQGSQTIDGIQLSPGPDASAVVIHGTEEEVVVEAAGFTGWAAKVPKANRATVHLDADRAIIDLATPVENSGAIILRFPDGGRAEIKAASTARFDLFKDGSYYFSGRGSVYAIDNAGVATDLSPQQPPMSGGPLIEQTGEKGTPKRIRATPITEVALVSGELGGELSVQVGTELVKLGPGAQKSIRLPNGSALELSQRSLTRTLNWKVLKGCFRFRIEGMNCWRPVGLTDQASAMQWNVDTRMADLSNLSTNQSVLVDLAVHYFAEVGPKAIFQYTQFDDCTTFQVSAAGGNVTLFNADTGKVYALDLNNFLVKAGLPENDLTGAIQHAGAPRKTILLYGESGAQFQVQGSLGSATLDLNSQKTLQGGGSGQVQMNYDASGRLTVRAVSGDFLILVPAAGNFSVSLSQGDAIALSVNPGGGSLTLQMPSGNLTPIVVTSAGGQAQSFGPNSKGTFKVGDAGPTLVASSGSVVPVISPGPTAFNEAAGAPSPNSSTTTPGAQNPNPIDVSRVQQLPVSPFK